MGASDLELRVAWQRHVAHDTAPEVASDTMTDATLESLLARHRGRGRHYHDVRHVQWVVRHVLELAANHEMADEMADLGAVVAAAFFHDAIYEPDRADNEARSAELASATLRDLGWDTRRREHVAAMILATRHLTVDPDTATDTATGTTPDAAPDTAILVAADLAVLAAEPSAYADYVRNVRREYELVDDERWRAGRSAVLEAFLARPSIFPPELGLDAWERRARANLTAELAMLH